jgi:REP element-mobilizing transposase RayT
MPSPRRLQYGVIYHIHNRGVNRGDIFIEPRNYDYFLHLYQKHITPVVETFAFCLLKNHFHLAVRIKTEEEVLISFKNLSSNQSRTLKVLTPSQSFSNFFNAYAKSINKAYQRTGSLFQNPFGRKPIDNRHYFQNLVVYIHQNAQKHGFVSDFQDWPHSSYQAVLDAQSSIIARETVLECFGGLPAFQSAHAVQIEEETLTHLSEDDDLDHSTTSPVKY